MGTSISKQLEKQVANNDEENLEMLRMLEEMMVNKVVAAAAMMKDEAFQNNELPVLAIVGTSRKFSVNVTRAPDEEIAKVAREIPSGDFTANLIGLLSVALCQFLGNTAAGSSEKKFYHILAGATGLLRVDFMLYKYQFSSDGIKDEFQNVFCYCSQIAVLDQKKVSREVLLGELTRAIGPKNISVAEKKLQSLLILQEELYRVIIKSSDAAFKGSKESVRTDHVKEIKGDEEKGDDQEEHAEGDWTKDKEEDTRKDEETNAYEDAEDGREKEAKKVAEVILEEVGNEGAKEDEKNERDFEKDVVNDMEEDLKKDVPEDERKEDSEEHTGKDKEEEAEEEGEENGDLFPKFCFFVS